MSRIRRVLHHQSNVALQVSRTCQHSVSNDTESVMTRNLLLPRAMGFCFSRVCRKCPSRGRRKKERLLCSLGSTQHGRSQGEGGGGVRPSFGVCGPRGPKVSAGWAPVRAEDPEDPRVGLGPTSRTGTFG